jgi:hypothetical protein
MTPADPTSPILVKSEPSLKPNGLLAEPAFEECHAEWIRYHQDRLAGRLDFRDIPDGHHIAYYAARIVDHDSDFILLQRRAASSLDIHPARFVIDYPWM